MGSPKGTRSRKPRGRPGVGTGTATGIAHGGEHASDTASGPDFQRAAAIRGIAQRHRRAALAATDPTLAELFLRTSAKYGQLAREVAKGRA